MNVETIQMDPRIASIHYKDYRKKVREMKVQRVAEARAQITEGNKKRVAAYRQLTQMEKEDIIMMESYRAMAKGQRILNVANAIRGAGLCKEKRLPVLALARANWQYCYLKQERNRLCFSADNWISTTWSGQRIFREPKKVNPFRMDLLGAELTNEEWRKQQGLPAMNNQRAVVPAIPAYLRPAGNLEDYHVLFEAKWEKCAPPDPILLKHISGHMYSVLAQWDLTDVEKAVLEGRFA